MCPDIGDVDHPDPIRLLNRELLLKLVRGHNGWTAVFTLTTLITRLGTQSFSLHDPIDPILTAGLAQITKI